MQPLFAGELFSAVMNARVEQMQAEVQKLKCGDVENLTDDQLSDKAQKIAEKYVASDIPKLDRTAADKSVVESTGKRCLLVPFSGGDKYFKYSPSEQVPGLYAETIEKTRISIPIEDGSISPAEAEERAERVLNLIEKALLTLQQDADRQFPIGKMKESAKIVLKKKQDSCARLRASGYSVR